MTTVAALLLITAVLYLARRPPLRWWTTRRPARCPACQTWTRINDLQPVRHASGLWLNICPACYNRLYQPFSQKDSQP
jgi:hypothetical protein